jgi:hypothetical protein
MDSSLENNPSSSENDQFLTPNSSPDSASESDNPVNRHLDEKRCLEIIPDEERDFMWKNMFIQEVNQKISDLDPEGKCGKIPENEKMKALRLDSSLTTKQDMEEFEKRYLFQMASN